MHVGAVSALAVARCGGELMIITGGEDGTLRSRRLDGVPGSLDVVPAHANGVRALAVVESWNEGTQSLSSDRFSGSDESMIVSGGGDGALRSWHCDGRAGDFNVSAAHDGGDVSSLTTARIRALPLLISGGTDGMVRSWRPAPWWVYRSAYREPPPWTSLGDEVASELGVRRLSYVNPLEVQLHLPEAVIAAPVMLGFILYALRRLSTVDLDIRVDRAELRARLAAAEQEARGLAENPVATRLTDEMDRALEDSWQITETTITDPEE